MKIGLIGDCHVYDEDCAILKGNILTVLQNDTISQINVISGEFVFYTRIEDFGCNIGIYEIETGYIIYGEEEIKMLDFNFNTKWKFSGKDIFISISGKKHLNYVKIELNYMILMTVIMKLILKVMKLYDFFAQS